MQQHVACPWPNAWASVLPVDLARFLYFLLFGVLPLLFPHHRPLCVLSFSFSSFSYFKSMLSLWACLSHHPVSRPFLLLSTAFSPLSLLSSPDSPIHSPKAALIL